MNIKGYLQLYVLVGASVAVFSCATSDQKQPPPKGGVSRDVGVSLIKPTVVSQCTRIDENVSIMIQRGTNECISQINSFGNTECTGNGDGIVQGATPSFAPNVLFIGPLIGTNSCSEFITVAKGSPCRLYETCSGGNCYKFCYHDTSRQPLADCLNHTGICGPPHNP
jgi:hypothetical protein